MGMYSVGVRGGKSINNMFFVLFFLTIAPPLPGIHLRVIVVHFPECLDAVSSKQSAIIDQ